MNERQIGKIFLRNHNGLGEQAVQGGWAGDPLEGLQANGPLVVALSKVTRKYSDLEMAGHSL